MRIVPGHGKTPTTQPRSTGTGNDPRSTESPNQPFPSEDQEYQQQTAQNRSHPVVYSNAAHSVNASSLSSSLSSSSHPTRTATGNNTEARFSSSQNISQAENFRSGNQPMPNESAPSMASLAGASSNMRSYEAVSGRTQTGTNRGVRSNNARGNQASSSSSSSSSPSLPASVASSSSVRVMSAKQAVDEVESEIGNSYLPAYEYAIHPSSVPRKRERGNQFERNKEQNGHEYILEKKHKAGKDAAQAMHDEGYNSSDEYYGIPRNQPKTKEQLIQFERDFEGRLKTEKGYVIESMAGDGNCLFRAVAHQVYGDADMHDVVRARCMDHIESDPDHFAEFILEDFKDYVSRKRNLGSYANAVEIQAITEIYGRPIEVYYYDTEPINIFQTTYNTDNPPIRVSYHRRSHYNSIIDPLAPSVGVGLGLPSLDLRGNEKNQILAATKESEELEIEKEIVKQSLKESELGESEKDIESSILAASEKEYYINLYRTTGYLDPSLYEEYGIKPENKQSPYPSQSKGQSKQPRPNHASSPLNDAKRNPIFGFATDFSFSSADNGMDESLQQALLLSLSQMGNSSPPSFTASSSASSSFRPNQRHPPKKHGSNQSNEPK